MVKTTFRRRYVTFGSLIDFLCVAIRQETSLQPQYAAARVLRPAPSAAAPRCMTRRSIPTLGGHPRRIEGRVDAPPHFYTSFTPRHNPLQG